MDEGHCADVQAFLVCIGRANAVRLQALRNHPQEDAQHHIEHRPVALHEVTKPLGNRQHPLAHRQAGEERPVSAHRRRLPRLHLQPLSGLPFWPRRHLCRPGHQRAIWPARAHFADHAAPTKPRPRRQQSRPARTAQNRERRHERRPPPARRLRQRPATARGSAAVCVAI